MNEPFLELEHGHAGEVVLLGEAAVTRADGARIPIPKLVLDTGLSWALSIPEQAMSNTDLDQPTRVKMGTLGGSIFCWQGDVELTLGPWRTRVSAVLSKHGGDWLLGYPVLRQFDLLLRGPPLRPAPRLVGPEDPILPRR